jgi:N-acetylglucosaminyldiphosphoundecaprenol N-acetyl-beta-D-mannosaminyltransferase
MRRLLFRRPIIWTDHPAYVGNEAPFSPRAVVLDLPAVDDAPPFGPGVTAEAIRRGSERADLLLVADPGLLHELQSVRPDAVLLQTSGPRGWEDRAALAAHEVARFATGGGRRADGPADAIELSAAGDPSAASGARAQDTAVSADAWGRPDSSRTTILFLPCNMRIGGAERQLADLAKGLDRTRYRPLVTCFRETGPFFDELVDAGIPARFLDMRPYYDLRGVKAALLIASILRRERVDILQTYEFNTKLIGWVAGFLARTPVVVSSEHATGEMGDTPAKNRLLCVAQVLCDRFIYVADAQRRFYEEQRGLAAHRSHVIYNGIDPERFNPETVEPLPCAEFDVPEDAQIVGITAVLRPEKAHEVLLRATAAIADRFPSLHLLLLGDGPERPHLSDLAERLGISERVHFTGYRTDVARVVSLFDVTVLCSDPVVETFPLSLLEAMCLGKPVVATAVSGVPEIVVEGETGYLVASRDHLALAERIAALLSDPERRARFGAAGRRRILENFTTSIMCRNYDDFYHTLAANARPPEALPHAYVAQHPERVDVLGIGVDPYPLNEVLDRVVAFARGGAKRLILYSNVHVTDMGYHDADLRRIINSADLVYVDGSGIRVGATLLGRWLPPRMTGADWIYDLCNRCITEDLSLYFLAGEPGIAERAKLLLETRHPGLRVVGTHHGYLANDSQANAAAMADITRTKPDIVIVGMGTPIQERWIDANYARIEAPVVWAAGAVFDFVTGAVRRGPRWMLDHHLEWAARLVAEPGRLWRRYVIGNPLFLIRVLGQRRRSRQTACESAPTLPRREKA